MTEFKQDRSGGEILIVPRRTAIKSPTQLQHEFKQARDAAAAAQAASAAAYAAAYASQVRINREAQFAHWVTWFVHNLDNAPGALIGSGRDEQLVEFYHELTSLPGSGGELLPLPASQAGCSWYFDSPGFVQMMKDRQPSVTSPSHRLLDVFLDYPRRAREHMEAGYWLFSTTNGNVARDYVLTVANTLPRFEHFDAAAVDARPGAGGSEALEASLLAIGVSAAFRTTTIAAYAKWEREQIKKRTSCAIL
jgi:hypothetical protein